MTAQAPPKKITLDEAARAMDLALLDLAASRQEVEDAVARLQSVLADHRIPGEDP